MNFKKYFIDLITAYNHNNFDIYLNFSKDFLEKYKFVLINPKAELQKSQYFLIDSLENIIASEMIINRLCNKIEMAGTSKNYEELMATYDKLISNLKAMKKDSLVTLSIDKFNSVFRDIFENEKSRELYQALSQNEYVYPSFLKEIETYYRNKVKKEFKVIRNSMDITQLKEFDKKHPNVLQKEKNNLYKAIQGQDQLYVLRNPSLDALYEYYQVYPRNSYLDKKLKKEMLSQLKYQISKSAILKYQEIYPEEDVEELLYSIFKKTINRKFAIVYLELFPEGKYANDLNSWLGYFSYRKNSND